MPCGGGVREILPRGNVYGINTVLLEDFRDAVVLRHIPSDVRDGKPHNVSPAVVFRVAGSDWAYARIA